MKRAHEELNAYSCNYGKEFRKKFQVANFFKKIKIFSVLNTLTQIKISFRF